MECELIYEMGVSKGFFIHKDMREEGKGNSHCDDIVWLSTGVSI